MPGLIGGTQVVERKDGATLRQEMNAALQSAPDAVGLISWNEFSENSYVEPSRNYGRRYLDVLKDIQQGVPPGVAERNVNSSGPGGSEIQPSSLLLLGGLALVVIGSLGMIIWRNLREKGGPPPTRLLH